MKTALVLLTFCYVTGYSQMLPTKDSCIEGTPLMVMEKHHLGVPIKDPRTEGILLITSRKSFESSLAYGNSNKVDTFLSRIDFWQNNVIRVNMPAAGCRYPTVTVEYFGNQMLQINIHQNGYCAMLLHIHEYFIVPKKIVINSAVKICKSYSR